jgi:hypothetical protein
MLTGQMERRAVEVLGYADREKGQCKGRLARRLPVVMHRMWVDCTDFRWSAVAEAMLAATSIGGKGAPGRVRGVE